MESLARKLFYTAVVYFLFLQLALRYGICGPTLSDLKINLGVSTDDMSKSVSVMSLGICIGAISCGFICKYLTRELFAFIAVTITSILVATITFLNSYEVFLLWNLLVGFTSGAAISLCESWILDIWGNQCGPYMQALQFFRGLGYIIAPLLADPFLLPTNDNGEVVDETLFNNGTKISNETISNITILSNEKSYNSKIRTPYILNAIMLIVAAIFLLCLHIYQLIEKRKSNTLGIGISQTEILSNSVASISGDLNKNGTESVMIQDKDGQHKSMIINRRVQYFGYMIVFLSSIFYLFFYEEVFVIFLPTFAQKLQLKFTKSEASMLSTAFSLSNLVGKAIGVLLALKISHFVILYMNLSLMISSLVVIIIFGNNNATILWIAVCIHGVGLSSIIASLYTLMESTIQMNTLICGILNMAGTSGSVIMPLVIGSHLDTVPMSLIYACLTCSTVCLAIYIVMHILLMNKTKLIAVPIMENKRESFSVEKRKQTEK
ncbi:hypothetical protein BLOT_002226 [Blomia tropicalis]|nr:hypothetical protein BLOT_002226 [Blomia tropicalis]